MKRKTRKSFYEKNKKTLMILLIIIVAILFLFRPTQPGQLFTFVQMNPPLPETNDNTDTTPDTPTETEDIHWWTCESYRISYLMDYQNITPRSSGTCEEYARSYCTDIGQAYAGLGFISPNCCMWNCDPIESPPSGDGTYYSGDECRWEAVGEGKDHHTTIGITSFDSCADAAFYSCDLRGTWVSMLDYLPENCCIWNCYGE
jgi:hypothetical protein